jgi:hypothetical protein
MTTADIATLDIRHRVKVHDGSHFGTVVGLQLDTERDELLYQVRWDDGFTHWYTLRAVSAFDRTAALLEVA